MSLTILNSNEIKSALPMVDAIAAMRKAFIALNNNEVNVPLRTGIHIPKHEALMLSMPAYASGLNQLGIKIVSLFPKNQAIGLPTIPGLVILLNAATGAPQALLEGGALTALRTGAVSGLATDLLARKDATTLAIIGSGVQAYTQLEAVCCVRPIKQVKVFSRNQQNAELFIRQVIANGFKCAIEVASSIQIAVKTADVICTATPATQPLIDIKDVKPGVHINAVGSHSAKMAELGGRLLTQSKVVVDQRLAALAEAGEIIQAIQAGLLKEEALIELGEVISQHKRGRSKEDEITIFKSVGLAIQDLTAASQALENAIRKNLGSVVDL